MEKPIDKLFPYVCPSCGGRLETDDNRKLMICKSCGNAYDYDYFCEENLIKAADKALAHKNYSAARDMYSFMLDKEPSNVKALRGLILSNNQVNRLYDITQKMKDGTFLIATFDLKKYRNDCGPESTGFFDKTDKVLSLYKEYLDLKKAGKNLQTEADAAEPESSGNDGGFFYYASDETLKKTVRASLITIVVLGIFAFAFGVEHFAPAWLIAMLVTVMIVAAFIIMISSLELHSRKRKKNNQALSEADMINARIEENKGEMDRIIREINDVFKDMNLIE